ncbi:MAG: L,D-transpeptidase family protein [Sphingomonas sp.]|nr:L,D-transpeptidase family protein [Sphingomonas sp.]
MTRLIILLILVMMPLGAASASPRVDLGGRAVLEVAQTLKTGEFIWAPERSPTGPALLVVNLDTQRAILFRNGVPIAASTMSSGRPGYETPTGVFTILQKRVEHYSRTYDNAPMPYMQRLTWKGVAIHAGHLPGYAASHGCIRLPKEFARLLYGATKLGMTVVITRLPARLDRTDELPLFVRLPADRDITDASFDWHPERASRGIASVIVSIADQRAIVLRNGEIIGSAPVRVEAPADMAFAYLLHRWNDDGRQWLKLQLDGKSGGMELSPGEASRFRFPEGFRKAVLEVLRPGSIIVVTPEPLRSGNAGAPVTVIEDEPSGKARE